MAESLSEIKINKYKEIFYRVDKLKTGEIDISRL